MVLHPFGALCAGPLAAAVKKGEPWAVRWVLDHVYPAPPPGEGQGDADLPEEIDLSAAVAGR